MFFSKAMLSLFRVLLRSIRATFRTHRDLVLELDAGQDKRVERLPGEVIGKLEQENILDRPSPKRAKVEYGWPDPLPFRIVVWRREPTHMSAGVDEVEH